MSTTKALVFGATIEREVVEELSTYGLSFVAAKEIAEVADSDPDFIFIKNYLHPLNELKKAFPNRPIISLGPILDIKEFIRSGGKVILNSTFLQVDLIREFLGRFVDEKTSSLNLEFLFKDKIQGLENIKISGHMSIGYYMDMLAVDIYERNFNVVAFREYFVSLITYFTYLKKAGIAGFPFEVEYGELDGQFIVQCSINVSHFVTEYIQEAFEQENISYPVRGLLKRCYLLSDIFDVSYIERKSKLVFTAVWLDTKKFPGSKFNSFFLNKVHSFDYKKEKNYELLKNPRAFYNQAKEDLIQELEEKELPGFFMDMFLNQELLPSTSPSFLIRLVRFIIEEKEQNDDAKLLENFVVDDIKFYLQEYPDTEQIERLQSDDYEFILNCLHSVEHLNDIEDLVEEVTTLVKEGKLNQQVVEKIKIKMDNIIQDDIQRVKGRIDEDETSQLVKGKIDEDQSSQLVTGKIDEDETVQIVKGKIEEDDVTQVVKGRQENLTPEVWKLKHAQFIDEATSILHEISTDNLNVDTFKEKLSDLTQEKFNLDGTEADIFLEELFGASLEDVINDEVLRRMQEKLGVEGDVNFARLLKSVEEKEKIIKQLQQRVMKLSGDLKAFETITVSDDSELRAKTMQLARLNSMKQILIDNLKKQITSIREESDKKLVDLRSQADELKKEVLQERAQGYDQSKDIMIKNLEAKVETKDRIIAELQNRNNELQNKLNEKPKPTDMENKVITSLNEQKEILISRVKKAEDEVMGKRVELKKALYQMKQFEDKVIKLRKKVEQQAKQLEKLKGKSGKVASGGGTKEKMLEKKIEKLNEIIEKGRADISAAKKDAISYKNENVALRNEVAELKRKLGRK